MCHPAILNLSLTNIIQNLRLIVHQVVLQQYLVRITLILSRNHIPHRNQAALQTTALLKHTAVEAAIILLQKVQVVLQATVHQDQAEVVAVAAAAAAAVHHQDRVRAAVAEVAVVLADTDKI